MHNIPTNNETNIIRNIFNVSTKLNESKNASLRPINELADVTEKEINAISDPELRAKTMDQFIKTKATKAETAKLNAESEAINKERLQIASGEPSQEYKDFVAGVPGGKPREGASAYARADYAARQRNAKDKVASDVSRTKEAEESKARVKAWQSSPQYQKEVEADRAAAAARQAAREKAKAAAAKQAAAGPGSGVEKHPFGKIGAGAESETAAYERAKDQSYLQVAAGAVGMSDEDIKERELEAAGAPVAAKQQQFFNSPESTEMAARDPRMLPQLVDQGKISQKDAEEQLNQHLKSRGGHDDITKHVEQKLQQLKAKPTASGVPSKPTTSSTAKPTTPTTSVAVAKPVGNDMSTEKPNLSWENAGSAWDEFTKVLGNALRENITPMKESYYRRLANLFEETRDSLEDISAKRRERQVKVAGLEGQVNPHGFKDLVKGIRNVQAFSGMGGGGMPKERVEKQSENVGERTVAKADQRKALMAIMSASQDHADLKDRFTKEDALNPHSPLHKMLVSRNPDLRDESKVMAKYYTGS